MKNNHIVSICQGCNLEAPTLEGPTHPYLLSSASCWDLYSKILEKEYSNPEYMVVHRLTVDAYCAQHPGEPNPKSIQSINVHLVGLFLVLERQLKPEFARKVIGIITNHFKTELNWIEPTFPLGEINVSHVVLAKTAEEHRELVYKWAKEVWAAWGHTHEKISELAERGIQLS